MADPWDNDTPVGDDTAASPAPWENDTPVAQPQGNAAEPWENDKPVDESSLPGAVGREVVNQAPAFAGGLAGMAAGGRIGLAAGAAAAPFLGPAAPIAPIGGALIGGAIGGLGGGYALDHARDWLLDKMGMGGPDRDGFFSKSQMEADAQQHPAAKDIADVGLTAGAFAFNPAATVAQRLLGAGAMGGLEAGQEAYTGDWDASKIAMRAAEGAVFTDPRKATAAFMAPFEKAAQAAVTRAGRSAPMSGRASEDQTPPAQNADVGNNVNPPERSEQHYPKDNAAPTEQNPGVVNTPDFMTPEFMAALESQNQRNLTEGPVKGKEFPDPKPVPAEEQAPINTGFEGFEGKLKPDGQPADDQPADTTAPRPNPIKDMVNRMSDEDVIDASRRQRETMDTPKGNGLGGDMVEGIPESKTPAPAFDTAPAEPRYKNPLIEGMVVNRTLPVDGGSRLKGNELYVDRNVPRSMDMGNGKTVDPAVVMSLEHQAQINGRKAQADAKTPAQHAGPLLKEYVDHVRDDWVMKNGGDPQVVRDQLVKARENTGVKSARAPEQPAAPEFDVNLKGEPDVTAAVTPEERAPRTFREEPPAAAPAQEEAAPAPEKKRAYASNGMQARTQADAERIDRSLLASDRGMEKAKPVPEEFDPRDRKQVSDLKTELKGALEHARSYNKGELPHESYKPNKGRGDNVQQPPSSWLWSRAADHFIKGHISAQDFAVQDRLYRTGNAEDAALASKGNKIEADIKMSRNRGDEAVANAEREAPGKVFDYGAEDIAGTPKAVKTREDLPDLDISHLKMGDEDKIVTDTNQLKDNLAKVYDEPPEINVSEKMKQQRAAREAAGLIQRGETQAPLRTPEGKASEGRNVQLTDEVKKAALAAFEKAKQRGATPETSDVHGPEVLPKTPYKDLYDRFGRDENGSLDYRRVNAAFKAKVGELKDAANKYFGMTVNNVQRHFDPILASAMSLHAKLSAEKAHLLEARWYQWNKQPVEDIWKYFDVLEKTPDKAGHQDFADALKNLGIDPTRARWMADEAIFHRTLMDQIYKNDQNFVQNYERLEGYVAHQFKDAKGVQDFLDQRRQQLGATWFTKDRVFETIAAAQKAGFELRHTNPMDIISHRWASSINDQVIVSTLRKLNSEGMAYPVASDPKSPTPVWASKSFIKLPATPDGVAWMIAPEGKNLWENAMQAKSLFDRDDALGGAFRSWMKIKNVWMPLQLGLSLFHEVHVAANINPVSNFVRAARLAYGTGDIGELGKALKYSITDPVLALPFENIFKGKLGDIWKNFEGTRLTENFKADPATLSPADRAMQTLIQETGAALEQNKDTNDTGKAFAKAWQDQSYPGIAGNAIARGIQGTQDWMMKYQIPRLKAVALKRDIVAAIRLDPSLTTDAAKRRLVMRQIGQNIDDRFGEMHYKSLFVNRYLKDTGIASFLSLSWNVGQVRQFSGALHDAYDLGKLATGIDAPSGARRAQVLSNDRIAFVSGYIGMSMAAAGGMSYALSGVIPSGLDWIMPRNGENNPDGTPARLSVPFNTREGPMLVGHTQEAGNVLSGLWHMLYNKMIISPLVEAAQNRDFFGRELFDPHAPAYKRAVQLVDSTLLNHLSPISAGGAQRASDLGGGARDQALAYAGFGPAPAYISHDAMQNAISHDFYSERGERPYEYGKTGLGRGLVQNQIRKVAGDKLTSEGRQEGYAELNRGYVTGDKEAQRTARMKLMQQGGLSGKTAGSTKPDQQFQRMFRGLSIERQVQRFKDMTPEQKQLYVYRNPLLGKSGTAKLLKAAGVNLSELPSR